MSLLELIRRQYQPKDYVIGLDDRGEPTYLKAAPGTQSAPGLLVFRFDATLFYANANRFVDDIQKLITKAPDKVRWLVLDAGSLDDVDYSAGLSLAGLLDFTQARGITVGLARADDSIVDALDKYGVAKRIGTDHLYGNLVDAVDAFRHDPVPTA